MKRCIAILTLIAAIVLLMCGCVEKTERDIQQKEEVPVPEYIVGQRVNDTIMNWRDPAVFYCYDITKGEEYFVITDMPSPKEDYTPRILVIKTDYQGLEGLIKALNTSFSGIVLAFRELSTPDAMYLHNAALTGTGMEQAYEIKERIELSSIAPNPASTQYYLGYICHDTAVGLEHELWNELSTGSKIVMKGNMAQSESELLQSSRQVYERVLKENGLDCGLLAIFAS